MATRLIVAIDVLTIERATELIALLAPLDVVFKIGYEAFYGYGDAIRSALSAAGAPYMLDLKLHDIPRTVQAAVRALVAPGLRLLTVHAAGGHAMLEAAVTAAQERAAELQLVPPRVLAITALTSLAARDLERIGFQGSPAENVLRLATLAHAARCSGVVCSVHEVAALKALFGESFLTVTPGIRPAGASHADQSRVATPRDARAAGVDYIVVGRPIVGDADPRNAARFILDELAAAV